MADNKQVKRPKVKTFYAANQALQMGAMDLSVNSKDGSVFMKFAPQKAYHADRRAKGEYDWGNAVNVKLDVGEIGGFIRALRSDGEFLFIHDFEGNKTTGGVKFYTTQNGNKGFGFSVKKGDKTIKVPVPVGDGELILEYFRFALDHIFSADYALDKKYWEDRAKAKAASAPPKQEDSGFDDQNGGGDSSNSDGSGDGVPEVDDTPF